MTRIDFEELGRLSTKMDTCRKSFDKCIIEINGCLQEVNKYWDSEVCDEYMRDINAHQNDLKEYSHLLRHMAEQMAEICDFFSENLK